MNLNTMWIVRSWDWTEWSCRYRRCSRSAASAREPTPPTPRPSPGPPRSPRPPPPLPPAPAPRRPTSPLPLSSACRCLLHLQLGEISCVDFHSSALQRPELCHLCSAKAGTRVLDKRIGSLIQPSACIVSLLSNKKWGRQHRDHEHAPTLQARACTTLAALRVAPLILWGCCAQVQQPERPFSTPPGASLEAVAAAADAARDKSQSAPPPGLYSGQLPPAAPTFSDLVRVESLKGPLEV